MIRIGQLRRWRTINGERPFLIVRSMGTGNSWCKILDGGNLLWKSHLDIETNSEVIDETR